MANLWLHKSRNGRKKGIEEEINDGTIFLHNWLLPPGAA
jgi:hypothetical protein